MARLITYGVDAKPELGDKTIGTDVAPGVNFKTKNYSLGDVIALFNKSNSLGVADQVLYLFQSDISEGRDEGTISFESGGGVGTSFSSVASVMMSKRLIGNKIISDFLPLFAGRSVILAELGNINNYGTYNVDSIVEHPTETEFFVVTLTNTASHGVMALDATYIFGDFSSADSYATTITDTATVTHNLGTRDVVVQLYDATTFETVYADVDRISTTQTTITFASTPTNSIRVLVQKIV